jgi:hypothetical protein
MPPWYGITILGPISAAYFNPAVTLVFAARTSLDPIPSRNASVAYVRPRSRRPRSDRRSCGLARRGRGRSSPRTRPRRHDVLLLHRPSHGRPRNRDLGRDGRGLRHLWPSAWPAETKRSRCSATRSRPEPFLSYASQGEMIMASLVRGGLRRPRLFGNRGHRGISRRFN